MFSQDFHHKCCAIVGVWHVNVQVEKLLAEIQAMEGQSPEKPGGRHRSSLDARVRIFERLASEVARLNFYAVRGKVGRLSGLPLWHAVLRCLNAQ